MENRKRTTAYVIGSIATVIVVILIFAITPFGKLQQVTASLDGRIEFYGRVIDHRGDPVAGARVQYITTKSMQTWRDTHDPVAETLTDERGKFKVERNAGNSLSIESIVKKGYRFVTKGIESSFGFGRISPSPHQPDLRHPVEFLLVPDEFDFMSVIRPLTVHVRLSWNSEPVLLPVGDTGEVLILHPTRDKKEGESRGFSWGVEIKIRNGVLLLREKGESLPLAPLTGYEKRVVVGYERGAAEWGGAFTDREFVFRTRDGNYGRFKLSITADREDGKIAGVASFSLNPTGERFLD